MVKKAFRGKRVAGDSLGFTLAHPDDAVKGTEEVAPVQPATRPSPRGAPASWAELLKQPPAEASTDASSQDGQGYTASCLDSLFEDEEPPPLEDAEVLQLPVPEHGSLDLLFEDEEPPPLEDAEATPLGGLAENADFLAACASQVALPAPRATQRSEGSDAAAADLIPAHVPAPRTTGAEEEEPLEESRFEVEGPTPRTALQQARRTLRFALQGVEDALADAEASTVVKNTFLQVQGRKTAKGRKTCGPVLSPRNVVDDESDSEAEPEVEASPHAFPAEYDLPCCAPPPVQWVVGVEVWYALCASQQEASALAARVQAQEARVAELEAQLQARATAEAAEAAELQRQAARIAELEAQVEQKGAKAKNQAALIVELEGKLQKVQRRGSQRGGDDEPRTPRGLRHLTRA